MECWPRWLPAGSRPRDRHRQSRRGCDTLAAPLFHFHPGPGPRRMAALPRPGGGRASWPPSPSDSVHGVHQIHAVRLALRATTNNSPAKIRYMCRMFWHIPANSRGSDADAEDGSGFIPCTKRSRPIIFYFDAQRTNGTLGSQKSSILGGGEVIFTSGLHFLLEREAMHVDSHWDDVKKSMRRRGPSHAALSRADRPGVQSTTHGERGGTVRKVTFGRFRYERAQAIAQ